MADRKENAGRQDKLARGQEQRGLVTDVIVPIAQGAAGGATGAWVTGKIGEGKKPPSNGGKDS